MIPVGVNSYTGAHIMEMFCFLLFIFEREGVGEGRERRGRGGDRGSEVGSTLIAASLMWSSNS